MPRAGPCSLRAREPRPTRTPRARAAAGAGARVGAPPQDAASRPPGHRAVHRRGRRTVERHPLGAKAGYPRAIACRGVLQIEWVWESAWVRIGVQPHTGPSTHRGRAGQSSPALAGTEGASLPANLSGHTYRDDKAALKSGCRDRCIPPKVKAERPTGATRSSQAHDRGGVLKRHPPTAHATLENS